MTPREVGTQRHGMAADLGMRQEIRANPRLYQAMDILYMPLASLERRMKQEKNDNPFLEIVEPDEDAFAGEEREAADAGGDADDPGDDIEQEDALYYDVDPDGERQWETRGGTDGPTREVVARPTLREALERQFRLEKLDARQTLIGEQILDSIDSSGFLSRPLADIGAAAGEVIQNEDVEARPVSPEEVAEALAVVQSFDPNGVAARDLRDTFLIQLRNKGERQSLAYEIVRDHWEAVIEGRWGDLERECDVARAAVVSARDAVDKLDRRPGLKYASEFGAYVVPDMEVRKLNGGYRIMHNDSMLPRLTLSRRYMDMLGDGKFEGEDRKFVQRNLDKANWIIKAVEQRRQTMLDVMSFIVKSQRSYFEKGIEHLQPLTLGDVAKRLGVHQSTVSRATNGKYVQTPAGDVVPLKLFFSGGYAKDDGSLVSARSVKAWIKELIDSEDPASPVSDLAIAQLLEKKGVRIARRTVAKYRGQLMIPSSRMRKAI